MEISLLITKHGNFHLFRTIRWLPDCLTPAGTSLRCRMKLHPQNQTVLLFSLSSDQRSVFSPVSLAFGRTYLPVLTQNLLPVELTAK